MKESKTNCRIVEDSWKGCRSRWIDVGRGRMVWQKRAAGLPHYKKWDKINIK